jgi:hypothetical protein
MGERILRFQGDASTEGNGRLVLLNVLIAKLSTSKKCNRLKSLTFSASLESNTLLTRDIRASVNGGAFKKCIALMRTL